MQSAVSIAPFTQASNQERGNVKWMNYDAAGYITSPTKAYGTTLAQTATYEYDSATHLQTAQVDALNRRTEIVYDAKGNPTQVTGMKGTPQEAIWNYTYEPAFNQVATITDPSNRTTTFSYDLKGNLVQVKDGLNNKADFAYNAAGQVTSVTRYPGGQAKTTTYTYDGGDLIGVTDPLNRVNQFFTDIAGRVVGVKDALGNISRTAYDNLDRVTSATDPLGNAVQFGYDNNGNLTRFTDAKSNATQFSYDTRNRTLSKTDPLTKQESYQYDSAGNLTRITDRKYQVSGFTYDALNRKITAGFGATIGAPTTYANTIAYAWDAGNRLAQVVDSLSGTITRSYDGFDRLTREVTPQGQVDYAFYANGLRQSMTVAGQSAVSYTWDNANRLTQIVQGTATVGFTYDEANRKTTLTLPSGVQIAYSYDDASQLTGINYSQGGTSLGNLTYGYDAGGRRIAMGGSLAATNLPTAVASTTYNTANRLTAWGGASLTHDDNGSLTSDGTLTYTWDARGRLATILNGSTTVGSFQYDAFNRRIGKTVSGTTTNFLHDGWQIVQELNGATPAANLLTGLGLDQVYRRTEGSTARDLLPDALGSVIALTDSAGVQTSYGYGPYGNTTASGSTNSNSFQYTGRENDGTGVYYYRNRYYHPAFGRFISEDPIGLTGGYNEYTYTGGDPISYVDPKGLVSDKIEGNKIQIHKNDVDKWPSDPHGHIYDKNQVVDTSGKIYDKATGKEVGKLSKKGMEKFTKLLKKAGHGVKCLAPALFVYDWATDGFGAAVDGLVWPLSETWAD